MQKAGSLNTLSAQVLGFLDKNEETDDSNHDRCLQILHELKYEVVFKKVDPRTLGLPCSRPRVHYQGIDRLQVANAAQVMKNLSATWDAMEKEVSQGIGRVSLDGCLFSPAQLAETTGYKELLERKKIQRKAGGPLKYEKHHADFRAEYDVGASGLGHFICHRREERSGVIECHCLAACNNQTIGLMWPL